jgi:hypothetical protein
MHLASFGTGADGGGIPGAWKSVVRYRVDNPRPAGRGSSWLWSSLVVSASRDDDDALLGWESVKVQYCNLELEKDGRG